MRISRGLAAVLVATFCAPSSGWAKGPEIQRVRVQGAQQYAEILIEGAFDAPKYSVRSKNNGKLIVIDVEGAALPETGIETIGRNALVSRTIGSTTAAGARIELGLTKGVTYRARADRDRIIIRLRRSAETNPATKLSKSKINGIHVEQRDGRDRIIVDVEGDASFRVSNRPGEAPRLEVMGAALSSRVHRRIDGPASSIIESIEVSREDDRTVIQAHSDGGSAGSAIRSGNRIVWLFTSNKTNSRPATRTIAREKGYSAEIDGPQVAGFTSKLPAQLADGTKRYSGRRIDLDFKDADIHNILRLISEIAGINIITADNVGGSVTIRMRNVPWDQALDVILQAKSLGMIRRGNLLRVAPLKQLEQERESAIARQKQQQQLAPLETRLVPVSYAKANVLKPRVKELLSSRGTVSVDDRTNMLIVRDIAGPLDNVEQLVRSLDTQTPQVLIEARIVEASSQYSRDVGIQWGGSATLSSSTGNPTGLRFPSDVGITGGAPTDGAPTAGLSPFSTQVSQPNFAVNLPAVTGNGTGGALGLTLGSLGGHVNLSVRLSAAETAGSVRIISSPRILTLDNKNAKISQGTLIPFSQVSAQGVNTAFQEATLELSVTPHVTSDGSVSMNVKITRDEPDFGRTSGQGDPTILKREATTDLLIKDGNTAVIGGIYTRNTGRNLDQVPFFGDIPVLGVFFRRKRYREDRNELLIFLTPRIVNRSESLPM